MEGSMHASDARQALELRLVRRHHVDLLRIISAACRG
jgi:hypothetical protein